MMSSLPFSGRMEPRHSVENFYRSFQLLGPYNKVLHVQSNLTPSSKPVTGQITRGGLLAGLLPCTRC